MYYRPIYFILMDKIDNYLSINGQYIWKMLYIVSTPIGNMGDMTKRAVDILKSADLILAEDTRRTGLLLHQLGIKRQMLSYNDHNKEARIPHVIQLLKGGLCICIVTDSGTPCISDPGFELVRSAVKNGIAVSPVPGPSAVIAALSASGIASDSFTFIGFLPKKEKAKKEVLAKAAELGHTFIFYESPYRLKNTVKMMASAMPEREICICRELTKRFEEFIRGRPAELFSILSGRNIKGEVTVVVGKPDKYIQ